MLRARWDVRDVDHKAVGGHLPLAKRYSTPVNVSPVTTLQQQNVHQAPMLQTHTNTSLNTSQQQGLNTIDSTQQHRKLDRSLSEPVKAQQQQQQQPSQANSSRYKTELCRPYVESGFCKYGDKCQFAHGNLELRTMSRHPKYKTELCRTFHTSGFCPYGPRCHFIHNAEERRAPSVSSHTPLSATSSLTLGCGTNGINFNNISSYLGSTADSPSPPASLHGSPTSSAGTFFDDSFSLFPNLNHQPFVDSLAGFNNGPMSPNGGHISGSNSTNLNGGNTSQLVDLDILRENSNLILLSGLETPPISPVESLAGDVDSLSLSSAPSDSPVPSVSCNVMDVNRLGRLPIFEKLTEDQ